MKMNSKLRSISLTLRGFRLTPEQVEDFFPIQATRMGIAGHPVKPGVTTTLKRSFIKFSLDFSKNELFDDALIRLIEKLGGVETICSAHANVQPEFLEINLVLPVKYSEEQESGFFEADSLSKIVKMHGALSFQFL